MPRGKLRQPRLNFGAKATSLLSEAMDRIELARNEEERALAKFGFGVTLIYCIERFNLLVGQIHLAMGTGVAPLKKYMHVARHFECNEAKFLEHYRTYIPAYVKRPNSFRRNYDTVTAFLFSGDNKKRAAGIGVPSKGPGAGSRSLSLFQTISRSTMELLKRMHDADDEERRLATNSLQRMRQYLISAVPPIAGYEDPYFLPYAPCCGCGSEPAPEGHTLVTRRNIQFPMCQACLDVNQEEDPYRVAFLYYTKSKEDTRLLDDFRNRIR